MRIRFVLLVLASFAGAQLYPDPSLFQPPLRPLAPGETLTINFRQGNWARVTTPDGSIGWVVSSRLSGMRGRVVARDPRAGRNTDPGSEFLAALGATNACWLPGAALVLVSQSWEWNLMAWRLFTPDYPPRGNDYSVQGIQTVFFSGLGLLAAAPAAAAFAVSRSAEVRSDKRLAAAWGLATVMSAGGLAAGLTIDNATGGSTMGIPSWGLATVGCALGAIWGYHVGPRDDDRLVLNRLAPPVLAVVPQPEGRKPAVVLQPLTFRF